MRIVERLECEVSENRPIEPKPTTKPVDCWFVLGSGHIGGPVKFMPAGFSFQPEVVVD